MQAEGQLDLARLADLAHGGVERAQQADAAVVAEADAVAGGQALGRPRERAPAALIDPLVQVEGDDARGCPRAAARPAAPPGSPRVVEHQRIAGPQQFGQIAHDAVLERAVVPLPICRRRVFGTTRGGVRAGETPSGGMRVAPPAGAPHRAAWPVPARCGRRAARSRTGRCAWDVRGGVRTSEKRPCKPGQFVWP